MADKASSSAVKDAPTTLPGSKTVLELLEEDDEFEVTHRKCIKLHNSFLW